MALHMHLGRRRDAMQPQPVEHTHSLELKRHPEPQCPLFQSETWHPTCILRKLATCRGMWQLTFSLSPALLVAVATPLVSNMEFWSVSANSIPKEMVLNFWKKPVHQYRRGVDRKVYSMHVSADKRYFECSWVFCMMKWKAKLISPNASNRQCTSWQFTHRTNI